ncbi:MAG TPA: EamA family transporter [Candidatus Paceibacterota bacterium]|nr:EamA family transporter [Candidatus Paceibacterota bacterium]
MWVVYAFGSAISAALVALFGKVGLQNVDPTLATIIRGVIMALLLIVAGFVFRKFDGFSFASLSGRAWLFILLAGVAGAASWLLYFLALKHGPASAVAVIDKLSVVFVIFLAAAFLDESLTVRSVIGVFLTVIGTLFILFK